MAERGKQRHRTRQVLGKSGRLSFFLMLVARNCLCVNAAAEGLQQWKEMMDRWQNLEVQVKESRWAEEIPQRWKQQKGEDRTKMKKEAKLLRCTLLNGSAWNTERKYMRRNKGKCDIFFGMEHRLREEKMEQQFNEEAKEGWRFAANAARITGETTGSEDRKRTSGGFFGERTYVTCVSTQGGLQESCGIVLTIPTERVGCYRWVVQWPMHFGFKGSE